MNLDHPALVADRAIFEQRLAELGADQVRAMIAIGAFPTNHNVVIAEWLAEQKAAVAR